MSFSFSVRSFCFSCTRSFTDESSNKVQEMEKLLMEKEKLLLEKEENKVQKEKLLMLQNLPPCSARPDLASSEQNAFRGACPAHTRFVEGDLGHWGSQTKTKGRIMVCFGCVRSFVGGISVGSFVGTLLALPIFVSMMSRCSRDHKESMEKIVQAQRRRLAREKFAWRESHKEIKNPWIEKLRNIASEIEERNNGIEEDKRA